MSCRRDEDMCVILTHALADAQCLFGGSTRSGVAVLIRQMVADDVGQRMQPAELVRLIDFEIAQHFDDRFTCRCQPCRFQETPERNMATMFTDNTVAVLRFDRSAAFDRHFGPSAIHRYQSNMI